MGTKPDWQQALDDLPTTRACGACAVCCTVLQIDELAKPAGVACWHLKTTGGCAIWGEHPTPCKTYVCLWRLSDVLIPPDLFPADCGFMLSLTNLSQWPTAVNIMPAPGHALDAWNTPERRQLFHRLAAAWNCPVVALDQASEPTHVFTPAGNLYDSIERPDVFPGQRQLALSESEYGPDRRAPYLRMQEADFRWRE
jgi:hypothetical protein